MYAIVANIVVAFFLIAASDKRHMATAVRPLPYMPACLYRTFPDIDRAPVTCRYSAKTA